MNIKNRIKNSIVKTAAVTMTAVIVVTSFPVKAVAADIRLNKTKLTLSVGQKKTLTVKNVNQSKKITWSSSNKKIATVSKKGVVTAKSAGNATVTAKVSGKKLKCTIKVNKKSSASPKVQKADISEVEKVLQLVNKERKKNGLSALVMDSKLKKAAQFRAEEIVKSFSHTRPNGEDCFTVFPKFGVTYMAAGENIAAGQRSAAAVMDSWLNSPGHRANILGQNFGKIGIGLCKTSDGYGYYWVQMFTD